MRVSRHSKTIATAAAVLALGTVALSAQSSSAAPAMTARFAAATRLAQAANGTGYWLVAADGGVFAFGTAKFYGSLAGKHLGGPITGIVPTNDDHGYWLVGKDGTVYSFGDATSQGSMAGKTLAGPVVGIASTHPGGGTAGAPGATGTAGPRGLTGLTGRAGAPGLPGAIGPAGATGGLGLTGSPGAIGPTGATGGVGPAGSVGGVGPAGGVGATGPAGATGAIGPAGPVGSANYAEVYNLTAETVAIEADIPLDSNGITNGFTHTLGTTEIVADAAGTYLIDFSVSATEPSQFAIFINGAPAPGAIFASGAGTQQDTGQVIAGLGVGDVVTVRNHSSAAAIGLASDVGGTQANVNASVVIEQLG